MAATSLRAQDITSVHGTVTDEFGGLMGATVCEIDATGRVINSAVTDLNGNFTMKVKNTKDKIRFTYVGMAAQILPINKTTYNIHMKSATTLKEVKITAKKRANGNGLPIPEREISYASQTISMKEFEGLGHHRKLRRPGSRFYHASAWCQLTLHTDRCQPADCGRR